MNARRWMPRSWLLLSVVWIVFSAWQRNIVCEFNLPYLDWVPSCVLDLYDFALHARTLAVLLGPPVLFGLIAWAALGRVAER
jgi:hypothetical protein